MSQAARDFGLAVTTVATMLAPHFESGELERLPHPADRGDRLMALTDKGRQRMNVAIPAYTAAYQDLVSILVARGGDPEAVFDALERLRAAVDGAADRMEAATPRSA